MPVSGWLFSTARLSTRARPAADEYVPSGQKVEVLLVARHRVNDRLGFVLEDQDDGFQQAGAGVEPEPQFSVRWAGAVQGLDPQWSFGSLDDVELRGTVRECAWVDLYTDSCASAARIASDRLMRFLAAAASRASSLSAVSRTATTCMGAAPRPGRPRPRCLSSSTS